MNLKKFRFFALVLVLVFVFGFCDLNSATAEEEKSENSSDLLKILEKHQVDDDSRAKAISNVADNLAKLVAPKIEPIEGTVDVKTTLRVRKYPWGPIVGGFQNGAKLKIIGQEGEFYKIEYDGGVGFVHKNYVAAQGKPAPREEISYPGDTADGGYLPPSSTSTTTTVKTPPTEKGSVSQPTAKGPTATAKSGDGTAAGAVTWALNQLKGGAQNGVNSNNGRSSKTSSTWNGWCLGFVATAYGRKVKVLEADSAYNAYKKCVAAGKTFHKEGRPPPGAVFFQGATSGNKFGHTFIATGEVDSSGDPYILTTTGWGSFVGIQKMTLSRIRRAINAPYLGWTTVK